MRKSIASKVRGHGRVNPSPSRRQVRIASGSARPRAADRSDGSFPVVGIGASAGGLEATTQLLKHLPPAPGPAFVVVQHLAPTLAGAWSALLSHATSIPVSEAKNNVRLEPNHVYVMPPGCIIEVAERRLKVSRRGDGRAAFRPIDHFLESLAEEERDRAIGVILSGNGDDGTRGLMAVRAAGGFTFAQQEKSAKFPSMPANAIASGCVDCVLSPEQIGGELARLAVPPPISPPEEKAFYQVLEILRQRTGVDFTHYKLGPLQRRIRRRMSLRRVKSLVSYARRARSHATEIEELFNDILSHVTGFFRDPRLFHALRKHLFPALVKNKAVQEPIRVWVPGCSTGQEAYSIAMALAEFMSEHRLRHPVQIFGTDIDPSALEKARTGVYAGTIEADVSLARLVRFFQRTEGGYLVNSQLRKACIFGRHNVVVDAPYSNLDLICCRNLLSYLNATLQRKVIPKFHYALKPDGFLVLGPNETADSFSNLFALVDKKVGSYRKKSICLDPSPLFGRGLGKPRLLSGPKPLLSSGLGPGLSDLQKQAERIVRNNYSPGDVIINPDMEVLRFRGRTSRGATRPHLLTIAHADLILPLRAAVSKAIKANRRVLLPRVRLNQKGYCLEAKVEVIPFNVPPFPEKFCLVLFRRRSRAAESNAKNGQLDRQATGNADLPDLNEELSATRESLEAVIQKQEATMEELSSANEEMQSSNEELQSGNDELETMRAEMQSTNEELITLNDLLQHRNAELERAGNDLIAVLGNVRLPILMLDSQLRLRRFTRAAEQEFGLIPGSVGRSIRDINLRLDAPSLPRVVQEAIANLTDRELKARHADGQWWFARISPCRTFDNKIEGAVIAFEKIDPVQTGSKLIRQHFRFADALIDSLRQPVLVLDNDLTVRSANPAFYRAFQVDAQETIDRRVYDIGNAHWNIPQLRTLLEDILPQYSCFQDSEIDHTFPHIGRQTMVLNARRLAIEGEERGLVLLSIEPLIENKSK